jgi:hypothetical protein
MRQKKKLDNFRQHFPDCGFYIFRAYLKSPHRDTDCSQFVLHSHHKICFFLRFLVTICFVSTPEVIDCQRRIRGLKNFPASAPSRDVCRGVGKLHPFVKTNKRKEKRPIASQTAQVRRSNWNNFV